MRAPAPRTLLRLAFPALLLALVAMMVTPAHAQWKWRDKNGQVNVSDRPPPRDVPDKDILARPPAAETRKAPAGAAAAASDATATTPPAAASAPVPEKPAGDRQLEARKRAAEQEAAAKAKAEDARLAEKRAENCRRARSHLAGLDSGQRIARMNDKGEREILDDRARAEEARQAREVIASECR